MKSNLTLLLILFISISVFTSCGNSDSSTVAEGFDVNGNLVERIRTNSNGCVTQREYIENGTVVSITYNEYDDDDDDCSPDIVSYDEDADGTIDSVVEQ